MKNEDITEKQKEIILNLYRFRFLNRIQIQTLLKNKDHRNINIWLKDLTAKKYINRIYEKSQQRNTLPAKYYLAKNGTKYLKSLGVDNLSKFYQESRRSQSFIAKAIFIADIYLKLTSLENLQNNSFKFYAQSDFPKDGIIKELLPDFAYVYKADGKLQHFVGEIFTEQMLKIAVVGRVHKYLEFFEDNEVPASIIFIANSDTTRGYIEKIVYRYLQDEGEININIYTTTREQIEENGMELSLFKKAETI